jgi:hypothetical protein
MVSRQINKIPNISPDLGIDRREVSSKTTYSILLQYLILIRHPVSFPLPKLASGSTSFFSYLRYSRLRDVMIKGLYTAPAPLQPSANMYIIILNDQQICPASICSRDGVPSVVAKLRVLGIGLGLVAAVSFSLLEEVQSWHRIALWNGCSMRRRLASTAYWWAQDSSASL